MLRVTCHASRITCYVVTRHDFKSEELKRIGIIRVGNRENSLTFRLDILDSSGAIISSEDMDSAADLKETIANKKIDDFFLDLPIEMLSFRILSLPFSDKKRLKEIVPFELQGRIIENIEDIVFDTFCLGKDGDLFKILVVYIGKEQFGQILSILSDYGIDPSIAGSSDLRDLLRETEPSTMTERLISSITKGVKLSESQPSLWKEEPQNPAINLRTGPFVFKGGSRLSRHLRILTLLLIVIAIVINLDLTMRIAKDRKDISLMRKEMRRSYSGLFPSERKITDELYQLKAHLKEAKERKDLVMGLSALDFLLNLSKVRSERVVINEIGLTTEGLTLKGEAFSMGEIEKLKQDLSVRQTVSELNISDLKPSTGGRLYFTVSGRKK